MDRARLCSGLVSVVALIFLACGDDKPITPTATIPAVTTARITAIKSSSAVCGGTVTSDGGAAVTARGVCWGPDPSPTIAGSKTIDGTGTGSYTSLLGGLTADATYHLRAYATNSAGTGYGDEYIIKTPISVTDIDGNEYVTVLIGSQVWMAENLKVTHYRNGLAIPNVTDDLTWEGLTTGAYCEYNNDGNTVALCGRLYNWHAVNDSQGLAPEGWHVATDAEWAMLLDYLGGWEIAGGKMKEAGTVHWDDPNLAATNESGFTALPAGHRVNGSYQAADSAAWFWTSTQDSYITAGYYHLTNVNEGVYRGVYPNPEGFSVRCIKDPPTP